MVYDDSQNGIYDSQWHCPFPREWVEKMARAAKRCERLTAKDIEGAHMRMDSGEGYTLPPGDFLSEPQDARGLPLSYCQEEERRYEGWPDCCTAIYDYDSIPEVVITDGKRDWPLRIWEPVLTA